MSTFTARLIVIGLAVLAALVIATSSQAASNTQVIRSVFGRNADAALRVARCESGFNTYAVGSAGERGLFQIHPIHRSWVNWGAMFNPVLPT